MNPQETKPQLTDAQIRADILDTAKGYVLKDRNSTYGTPEDNFKRIARRWTAHLRNIGHLGADKEISPISVAIMMLDLKAARLENDPTHRDSWIDTAGYAACGAGIALVPKQPEAFQIPKSQADMQREYVGTLSGMEPKLSRIGHPCGLRENPHSKQVIPSLLSSMSATQEPIDNDYMYENICGFLESQNNLVVGVSSAAFKDYIELHCKRKGLTERHLTTSRNYVDDICKRQGHTLYLC